MDWDEILIEACTKGHIEVVKLAIENGANIHFYNDLALRHACDVGHTDIAMLLIINGANIHAEFNAPLKWSSHRGFVDIVKILLKRNADYHDAFTWARFYGFQKGMYTLRRAKHELESERNSLKAG